MTPRRRLFLIWAAVLAALWVVLNKPRAGGRLKPVAESAGFPWPFYEREFGRSGELHRAHLAGDVGALAALVGIAWACARSRHPEAAVNRESGQPTPAGQ